MSGALDLLASGASSILGRSLSPGELESFGKYLDLLTRWQRVHRLVGSVEPVWVVENLFLDSLLFLRVLPPDIAAIADIGSGAGFPGLPIKIVRPSVQIALIESRHRRASFLSTVVRELGLEGVQVRRERAEQVPEGLAASFGAVVMRCAGDPGALLSSALRLVTRPGIIVFAGPPTRRPVGLGEWLEVPGVREGQTRRFLVYRA